MVQTLNFRNGSNGQGAVDFPKSFFSALEQVGGDDVRQGSGTREHQPGNLIHYGRGVERDLGINGLTGFESPVDAGREIGDPRVGKMDSSKQVGRPCTADFPEKRRTLALSLHGSGRQDKQE